MSKLLVILAVVYAILSLWSYQQTPQGQVAMLDAAENITLAQQITDGEVDSFYRAPIYAGYLSIWGSIGFSDEAILKIGQVSNMLFHLLTAVGIALGTFILWHNLAAALWMGALYAAYPIALYLSFDLLDTSLANCLMTWGLVALLWGGIHKRTWGYVGSIFLLLLASLTRSHMLVWLGFTVFVLVRETLYRRIKLMQLLYAMIALVLGTSSYLFWQNNITGQWNLFPTQAAYNLYAANEEGSLGESFVQKVEFVDLPEGYNPARAQAEYLYRQQTRATGTIEERTINKYWESLFWHELTVNPQQKISLYGKKLYNAFHNHEGYNNKTYAFQKQLNPYLRRNPLGFVLIASLALFSIMLARPLPKMTGYLLLGLLLYAAAMAIFYVSDRFRLPMVIPLLLLAGGIPSAIKSLWLRIRVNTGLAIWSIAWRGILLGCFTIAFTLPLMGVGQTQTKSADLLLLAEASLEKGQNLEAIDLAKQAHKLRPRSTQAASIYLKAGYNAVIAQESEPSPEWLQTQLKLIDALPRRSDSLNYMAGYYEWLLEGKRERWHTLVVQKDSQHRINALAALIATNSLRANEVALLNKIPNTPLIIHISKATLGNIPSTVTAVELLGEAEAKTAIKEYRKLFDRERFMGLNKPNAH